MHVFMRGRSRMTINPPIATIPGWSTSGFHGPGRRVFTPIAKRRDVLASRMKEGGEGALISYMAVGMAVVV